VSPLSVLHSPSFYPLTLARVIDKMLKGNRVIMIPFVLHNQFLLFYSTQTFFECLISSLFLK